MAKKLTKTTEEAALVVTAQDLLPREATLADYVAGTRSAFVWLKQNFKENVHRVADSLKAARRLAEQEGVEWHTLFTDPTREDQMPFSQAAAAMYLTVADAKLGKYDDLLPADLTVRYKLATVPARSREKVMIEYLKLTSVEADTVIDGELIEKPKNAQDAMGKAKIKAGVAKARTTKPKGFNAGAMARKLHKDLGDEGLSELCDAIERLLEEAGVRE